MRTVCVALGANAITRQEGAELVRPQPLFALGAMTRGQIGQRRGPSALSWSEGSS